MLSEEELMEAGFYRLKRQVEDLERRVYILERVVAKLLEQQARGLRAEGVSRA